MSLLEKIAQSLFHIVAKAGRPFGGIRPHRLAHQLSQLAYGKHPPSAADYRWYADRHGLLMKLHPYYLIDREIIAFGAYELPLQKFIANNIRPGMICMDVGANMGAMALHLALRVGDVGKVYAFEPVPANVQRLREHAARNSFIDQLEIVESALSDVDGTLELLIAPATHVNQGMGSLVEIEHRDLTSKINVQVQRLDSFCEQRALTELDFIKVDIQGAEPLFLAGARRTLKELRPRMVMEVAPSSLTAGGFNSKDLLAHMESLGYSAFALTKTGEIGSRLMAKDCSPTFSAENVLFEPQPDPIPGNSQ